MNYHIVDGLITAVCFFLPFGIGILGSWVCEALDKWKYERKHERREKDVQSR